VDSWDGRVFQLATGQALDFSVAYQEVLKKKQAQAEARLTKKMKERD
jgi:hypothetical protein